MPFLKERVGQNASNYKNEENQIKIENTNKFWPNNNDAITCKPNYMKAWHKNENVNQTTRSDLLNRNKKYQQNEWLTTNEIGQINNKCKTPKHKSVVKLQIGEQTNTQNERNIINYVQNKSSGENILKTMKNKNYAETTILKR